MSTHLHLTIRALEQDLEVKQGECADIERALVPLRRMAGVTQDGEFELAGTRTKRKYTRRAGPAKAGHKGKRLIKRTNERTNERSKARATSESPSEPP